MSISTDNAASIAPLIKHNTVKNLVLLEGKDVRKDAYADDKRWTNLFINQSESLQQLDMNAPVFMKFQDKYLRFTAMRDVIIRGVYFTKQKLVALLIRCPNLEELRVTMVDEAAQKQDKIVKKETNTNITSRLSKLNIVYPIGNDLNAILKMCPGRGF